MADMAVIRNITMLEHLFGGKQIWNNIVVVITKKDFNPME